MHIITKDYGFLFFFFKRRFKEDSKKKKKKEQKEKNYFIIYKKKKRSSVRFCVPWTMCCWSVPCLISNRISPRWLASSNNCASTGFRRRPQPMVLILCVVYVRAGVQKKKVREGEGAEIANQKKKEVTIYYFFLGFAETHKGWGEFVLLFNVCCKWKNATLSFSFVLRGVVVCVVVCVSPPRTPFSCSFSVSHPPYLCWKKKISVKPNQKLTMHYRNWRHLDLMICPIRMRRIATVLLRGFFFFWISLKEKKSGPLLLLFCPCSPHSAPVQLTHKTKKKENNQYLCHSSPVPFPLFPFLKIVNPLSVVWLLCVFFPFF